ncbi:PAP2_haloperoxidase domain-containing protein [Naegleria gruberi]|uniref:PAP2_haloperoxidase domain-containing protein n=1 Tax=Naegleria gruberi TaxID=5762 RepID=D2VY20_NAEGR|nr:PAP2_haloperoxidase domain-containing protein [Naegleria gruberi]EFC38247.1 PAP2_haloperoxidase domain-containing protein [Naegleria gruberi]|eukprot:XP_002670991.1 PAP2_haloperoxidase domain-containing protein [Naegleria gruberi strain NEG-M]
MMVSSYSPTTETDPQEFDAQFHLSYLADGIQAGDIAPITRYPDAYEKATSFYRNQYGLDISDNGSRLPPGTQFFTSVGDKYVVEYAKVRGYPTLAGSQDLGVYDDAFAIMLTQPLVVHGAYGGKNGTWVDSGSVLPFGFYTYFWKVNGTTAFPRITWSSPMPMRISADGSLVVDCELTSNIWGKGMARGLNLIRINPATGQYYVSVVSSHTFPVSQTDISPKCAAITTEKDIFNEDFIIKWNNVLLATVRDFKVAPPVASRAMAIVHSAVDDALGFCRRLRYTGRPCDYATIATTVSYAAHRVLGQLFPNNIDCYTAALKSALKCNGCQEYESSELTRIGKVAILAADRVLRSRDNDGSSDFVDYQFRDGPMDYQSHAPNYVRIPLLPQWSAVEPFGIQDVESFRQGPPPQIGTPAFETAYDEVFLYGRNDSSVRTFDQRRISWFWDDGAGTATPPGHWNVILQSIIRSQGITDTFKISAMFKLLGCSVADAGIVSWDHKYFYNALRPVTAVNNRNRNLNWFPLLATPPFPEYTSGHSTFSGAAARILSLLLGSDDITFDVTSDGYKYHTRTFNRLSDAAKEAGKSRIYGGIHFEYANQAGWNSGVAVANAVYNQLCRNGNCL